MHVDEDLPVTAWKWIACPLVGLQQTVPRAELMAVLIAIQYACGDLEIFTDHLNIVKVFQEGNWSRAIAGMNGDLWQQVKAAVDNSEWRTQVRWVNSHPEEMLDIQLTVPAVAYKGNKLADEKAGEAAAEHRIPDGDVRLHREAMECSTMILERLTTLGMDMIKKMALTRFDKPAGTRRHDATKLRRAQAMAVTAHHVITLKNRALHCSKCLSRMGPCEAQQVQWLREGCEILTGKPHSSHTLHSRSHIVWCARCGVWSGSRYRALAKECVGRPKTGLQAMSLRLTAKGRLPPGAEDMDVDQLQIDDEPPGGLWEGAGRVGPTHPNLTAIER